MTICFGSTVYSVSLVKEKTVHSGKYQLMLEVSDLQNKAAVHNITLTVCECSNPAMPNCRNRKPSVSAMGGGAFGIIFLSLLLLAGKIYYQHTSIIVHNITFFSLQYSQVYSIFYVKLTHKIKKK